MIGVENFVFRVWQEFSLIVIRTGSRVGLNTWTKTNLLAAPGLTLISPTLHCAITFLLRNLQTRYRPACALLQHLRFNEQGQLTGSYRFSITDTCYRNQTIPTRVLPLRFTCIQLSLYLLNLLTQGLILCQLALQEAASQPSFAVDALRSE